MIQLTYDNYESVLTSNRDVCVLFTAPWCRACGAAKIQFQKASELLPDVKFVTLDVDECGILSDNLGVKGLPTVGFFRDTEFYGKRNEVLKAGEIKAFIMQYDDL